MASSRSGWRSSNSMHSGWASQAMYASGHARRNDAISGDANTMSPMAESRTTRIRASRGMAAGMVSNRAWKAGHYVTAGAVAPRIGCRLRAKQQPSDPQLRSASWCSTPQSCWTLVGQPLGRQATAWRSGGWKFPTSPWRIPLFGYPWSGFARVLPSECIWISVVYAHGRTGEGVAGRPIPSGEY